MGYTVDNLETTSGGIRMRVIFKTMDAKEFIGRVQKAIEPVLGKTMMDVVVGATRRAPRQDPPDDSLIMAETIRGKPYKKGVGFSVRTNTKTKSSKGYGAYVEFGTSHAEAKPFLYPAYDEAMRGLLDDLRDRI